MNTVNWFEIPCQDIERATRFYEGMTSAKLKRENFFGKPHAIFPRAADTAVTGTLIQSELVPSLEGTVIYLNAAGEMDGWLARVAASGGSVIMPKTAIGPMGWIAQIKDTEGNRVGLHQRA